MNRSEFMAGLRKLLVSIPEDEREEALQYYEDYFEDAGPENEGSRNWEVRKRWRPSSGRTRRRAAGKAASLPRPVIAT